ncbi:MAG: hypothetical protein ACRYFS_02995 [Janthinobacterium lividum]
MTITDAVRSVYRKNKEAALGNMALLYAGVCQEMNIIDLAMAPNPGSVYRIGRRFSQYGLDWWGGKN